MILPPLTPIPFVKMHGAGNDFVVLDLFAHPELAKIPLDALAITLCDRHLGVGADGLLTLEPGERSGQLRMRMWNPDGTMDMCGNGLRCVAALAHANGLTPRRNFAIETKAGLRYAQITTDGAVRVSMGMPQLAPNAVPLSLAFQGPAIEYDLPVVGAVVHNVTSLSTGSTHTVVFTRQTIDEARFASLSPLIEHHQWFPERTSIMWAQPAGLNRFALRIWERGVGETLSCGTGACAVAVAARLTERATGPVTLECRGGALEVEWEPGQEIWLSGPTRTVYSGNFQPTSATRPTPAFTA